MREEIMEDAESDELRIQLPPFPIRECDSWDPIVEAVEKYAQQYDVCLRSRDSRLTITNNEKLDK
jgi:hypothetical protein